MNRSSRPVKEFDYRRLACTLFLLANSAPLAVGVESVSYSRDVQPILAQHCYTCHGPDSAARAAKLRLDRRQSALAQLPSGRRAVVPGRVDSSELIARIQATDDSRMPPDEHLPLSPTMIKTLQNWIAQGADWERHWAFQPLRDRRLTQHPTASENFIDGHLRQSGFRQWNLASRETLLRRVYLDVIGLPPSLGEMAAYLTDSSPDAYARLVDRLLASPHYGERWGRHWLDVARYADSNGGDENHAFPHAHHYRDYVINAFNDDTPYDQFVQEQLAGDLLLDDSASTESLATRITATGYLAIGMKILAEQDSVKQRADIVDEQIDTFGRTFLGLSLGCARCHDHKFDPITSHDYYALAGIFYSTKILDSEIRSVEFQRLSQEYDEKQASLQKRLKQLESRWGTLAVARREAERFDRGNVVIDRENYGQGIGIIGDRGGGRNFAEYDVEVPELAEYRFELRYAAEDARPGRILIDGEVAIEHAMTNATGGWHPESQQWSTEGSFQLTAGRHVLRIESEPLMSHIDRWRLLPVTADPALQTKLQRRRDQLQQLATQKPIASKVMAVQETEIRDAALHHRGSHLDLGESIPRGVIDCWGANEVSIGDRESGRLQLAEWLTAPNSPASALTARVIANRVWHWHFGKGLVESTDDFGIRGDIPIHGRLLDALAWHLIQNDWSLKALHKQILLSEAYQQPRHRGQPNDDARLFASKRLEPEVIRDSMLVASGELDRRLFDAPMKVISQNPSPENSQANQQFYINSRRRSVYLPIVRTNVYDFLTLFDFPNVATPVGRRAETTVPTQALWMLNSQFIDQTSRALAQRVVAESFPDDASAFDFLLKRIFTRSGTPREHAVLADAIQRLRLSSEETDQRRRQRDAWSMLIQTLFMSSEAIDAP